MVNILEISIQLGLLYAILALGVYIIFNLLEFPDLSMESSFVTGAIISAVLIINNVNPFITLLIIPLGGIITGLCTSILHIKLRISKILSSILTLSIFYAINLRLAGTPNLSVYKYENIIPFFNSEISTIIFLIVIVVIMSIILYLLLKTKIGYMLRAIGENENLVNSFGINNGIIKCLGLCLGNALISLSGGLTVHIQGFADVHMGTGIIIIGLASVLLGTSIFKNKNKIHIQLISVVIGSILYQFIINVCLYFGFTGSDLKLITAIIIVIILLYNRKIGETDGQDIFFRN